jgi:drug/metabolite transporter (DMT)-like permease
MPQPKHTFFPYLALALGVIALGFSAIFVRQAEAPSPILNLYRMGIATVLITPVFLFRRRKNPNPLPRKGLTMAVLAGIFIATDLTLWSAGVQLSGAANPTLMANTAPLWVGLWSLLIWKERRGRTFWAGLLLALTGSALILGQDALRSVDIGTGTLLGLLGSFFYSGYFLFTQRGREHLSSLDFFWVVAVSATSCLLLFSLVSGYDLTGYSRQTYLYFLALGVIVQLMGWLTINYAQGYLPAAIVSPSLVSQPVLTAIFAAGLIDENMTLLQGIAGGIVIMGIIFVHRSPKNEQT